MFHGKQFSIPEDRPVFMKMVDENEFGQPTINGYTLQVNLVDHSASIINLTKGGRSSMIKTEVKALEGFEKMYDELNEMKANLDAQKAHDIEIAIAQVEEKYAEKSAKIDEILAGVSVTVEVEVEDEVAEEEVVVDAEQVEATEVSVEGTGISF